MQKLTMSNCEKFLKNGDLTKPFLDDDYVNEKVMTDFNAKKKVNKNYTKIESLYHWINHNVKYAKGENDFIARNKFQRNAKEIWESKKATGCTDYALVFSTFARQIGIATTLLHTAEYNWCLRLKNGGDYKVHYGHSFCECFYQGKWILVDPTCRKIEFEYNPEKIELTYTVGENSIFIPYFRGLDLGSRQSVKEHNDLMEKCCLSLL